MTNEEFLQQVQLHEPSATRSQVLLALDGMEPAPGMARGIANQIRKASTALTVPATAAPTPQPQPRQTLTKSGRRAISAQAVQAAQQVIKEKASVNPVDALVGGLRSQVEDFVEQQAQEIRDLTDPNMIAARILARVAQAPDLEALDLSFELFGGQGDSLGTGDSAIPNELEEFLASVQSKADHAADKAVFEL